MGQELVAMTTGEFDHLEVIRRVTERSLTQTNAAELIGLSGRQVRRLRTRSSRTTHTRRVRSWVSWRSPWPATVPPTSSR